jgi:hypothetical protein
MAAVAGDFVIVVKAGICARNLNCTNLGIPTQHMQTTMDTLNDRKRSIPLSSLNQTFKDAINVTRSLGLQFLWIDSLCIIQDSPSDWTRESAKMCSVYSNAISNIAATSAVNGDDESF